MEEARKLRERADHYRYLLWDMTDSELANSLRVLIATCEARAAERLCEVPPIHSQWAGTPFDV
jgi:hypothetical protein